MAVQADFMGFNMMKSLALAATLALPMAATAQQGVQPYNPQDPQNYGAPAQQNPDHAHMSREDAYSLISVACDVDITQLVDLPRVGVHVMCPKAMFAKTAR